LAEASNFYSAIFGASAATASVISVVGATGPSGPTGPAGVTGATGPAGSATAWAATDITIPQDYGGGRLEHRQVISAVGVLPTNEIVIRLDPATTDTDENEPEMLDVFSLVAVAGTDEFEVIATFQTKQSGAIKLRYEVI